MMPLLPPINPPAPSLNETWLIKKQKMPTLDNTTTKEVTWHLVDTKVLGHLYVAKSLTAEGRYVLMLIIESMHYLILSCNTALDCQRVGEVLWTRFMLALRQPTREEVIAKLPAWVEPWLKEIRLQGYQEPPE